MDDRTKELIALGASAAVNCHPCLKHHLELADELDISRDEVRAAIEVGTMVNRGAARQTRSFVDELLGGGQPEPKAAAANCC
jgi:AhpD family alkylhydroperoxidase